MRMADRFQLTVYDAAYLELARRCELKLLSRSELQQRTRNGENRYCTTPELPHLLSFPLYSHSEQLAFLNATGIDDAAFNEARGTCK
jgi:hypothetical protein